MSFAGPLSRPTLRAAFFARPFVIAPAPRVIAASPSMRPEEVARVVVPLGTPRRAFGARPATRAQAEAHARAVIPRATAEALGRSVPTDQVDRSLIGDACDLLVDVVEKACGVRLPEISPDDLLLTNPGGAGPRVFIHVGLNPHALALLAARTEEINPAFRSLFDGDGVPDVERVFDGDGFALLCLVDAGATHVLVFGGSEYGTYYGVATLLRATTGVRWLFPGDLGEVIPTRGVFAIDPSDPVFNRYEEPDYRGRSLDLLSGAVRTSASEVDATRTWALNNRLHPSDERVYLREIVLGSDRCAEPAPMLPWLRLGKEVRIPSEHAMHTLLSPYDEVRTGSLRGMRVGDAYPTFFPDLRMRVSYGREFSVDFVGRAPSTPGTPRWLGVPLDNGRITPNEGPDTETCLGGAYEYDGWAPRGGTVDAPQRVVRFEVETSFLPAWAKTVFRRAPWDLSQSGGVFAWVDRRASLFRAIPRTTRTSRLTRHAAAAAPWKPCVYGQVVSLDEGGTPPPHVALVNHLASSLAPQVFALTRGTLRREGCVSMAFDDGLGWCQCDACAMSGTSSANGAFAGANVTTEGEDRQQLRLDAGRALFYEPVNDVARVDRDPTGFATYFNVRLIPGVAMSSAASWASRGYFMSWHCPDYHSRRVADLVRAVASRVAQAVPEAYVSVQAYSQWRGAPMTEDLQGALLTGAPFTQSPSYLGERVVVFVTSTADVAEYGEDASRVAFDPSLPADVLHYHYPRQFNEMRWAAITAQHGIYEYLYGGFSYMVPRLYSRQLRTALRRAHRRRARAFNAESWPMWGTEGPKWFEVAEMLWEVESGDLCETDAERRRVWAQRVLCDEQLGLSPEAMVDELVAIYDELERRWLRAVSLAESRNRTRTYDELYQPWLATIAGAERAPYQLDAFDGTSVSYLNLIGDLDAPCDLFARMTALQAWLVRSYPDRFSRARERLALFAAGLAPTAALTRASRPVRFAYRLVAPPPNLTQGWVGASPVLPGPADALYAPMQQSFQRIHDWVVDPRAYTRAIHLSLQDALIAHGVIRRGAGGAGNWQSLSIPPVPEELALGSSWLALDPVAVAGYVAAWNAATAGGTFVAARFEAGERGPIVAMMRAIKAWVIDFASLINSNRQPEFEWLRASDGSFQRAVEAFARRG